MSALKHICLLRIFFTVKHLLFVSIYNLTSSLSIVTAGVHDSYWTHAGDVEQMNRLLREKFVELYEQPVLENVS